ncbi:Ig-like domain-containing protein [Methylobacterium durans]|uniref:Ig-like domain-containing protein n=1 Tax=Methylobacterium durans TaxID=2202825 RepID=UPI002AFFF256|nr:Ig-like domain-containing protein [Methylobacterium durans]MEA1834546.1 Ig-like domain-containing protein [Methylobacterium durans]
MFERFRNPSRARSRSHGATRPPVAIRALEPRYVFDAAAAPAAAAAAQAAEAPAPDHAADHPAESHAPEPAARSPAVEVYAGPERREIVVIDRNVPDLKTLLGGVPENAEVLLIDSARDGFDQLAEALRGRSDIDAVHILSHGTAGDLRLGTGSLTADTMAGRYAEDLATIRRALGPDGDLLIYGCDFGAGPKGAEATRLLARATGADVAASDDATGDASLGGDWDLETRMGAIEAASILDAAAEAGWHHLLAPLTITVSGDPAVKDGAGNAVALTGGNYNVNSNVVGATALWSNVGTVDGVAVSLRATVTATGEPDDAVSFSTTGNDATVLVRSSSSAPANQAASITIRWEIVRADNPNVLVAADIDLQIGDIDGVSGQPNTRESVTPSQVGLTSYTVSSTTDLTIDSSNDRLRVSGTQNEQANPPASASIVRFDWTNRATWEVTYDLAPNNVTGQAAFQHDGDRSLTIINPVTTTIPKVDLDADDSAGTGFDYVATFTEDGPAVRVTDTDVLIVNTSAVDGAEIVLRNAKAGDDLRVGPLPGTITAVTDRSVAGVITVTLSGSGSPSDYQDALKAVTFTNTAAAPDTTDRLIDLRVSNGATHGTSSRTTISVVSVDDAPVNTMPSRQTMQEYTDLVFSDANGNPIRVADADAGASSVKVTVTAGNGIFTLARSAGLAVTGDGTGTVTLTGTMTDINAALDGAAYRSNAHFSGLTALTLTTDDLGNTGSGGPKATTSQTLIDVKANGEAPVVTGPPGRTVASEDTDVVFSLAGLNAITVSDADGGNLTVRLTAEHGLLTLARTAGLTFASGDGSSDRTMTFTGSGLDINLALDGLRFIPDADYNGPARIDVTVQDPPRPADNFTNGGFELPGEPANSYALEDDSNVPGWKTTASDHKIEIWQTGWNGVPSYEGNQFAEINATEVAALYQDFDASPGSLLSLDFAHRGRLGLDTMRVVVTDLGADGVYGTRDDVSLLDKNYVDGNTAWGAYHEELSQGASGNKLRFEFRSVSAEGNDPTFGNFVDGIRINQNFVTQRTIDLAIAPVVDIVADTVATNEDAPVTFNVLTGTNGASADRFEDPGAFVSGVTQGAHGRVAYLPDGRITYTPDADFNGSDSFSYTVTSGGTTETATVSVTIAAINDAPVHALPATQRTNEDTDLVLSGANALRVSDVDAGTGSLTTRLGVGHGTLTVAPGSGAGVSGDGTGSVALTGTLAQINAALDGLRYRPAADYNGADALTIVTDDHGNAGAGGPLSRTDTLALAVDAVNDAPRTGPLAARGSVDGASVSVDLGASYTDPEGDRITYTVTGLPPGLVADPATGRVSGRIDASASQGGAGGVYTVLVRAVDGQGGVTDASFTWRVLNPVPVARNDALFAQADRSLAGSVLADNGNGPDADPDGDRLAIIAVGGHESDVGRSVAGSAGGTFTVQPDGRYAFDPGSDFADLAPGAARTTTVTYTVSDGEGGLATAQVSVTVGGRTPTLPSPAPLDLASNDGQPLRLDLSALFPGRSGVTYAAAGLPPGLALDPVTGLLSGTVAHDASGPTGLRTYLVTLTATDANGASEARSFGWRIANLPPSAKAEAATTPEDTPLTLDVLANDTDPDGDVLTIVQTDDLAPSAAHGRVSVVVNRLVYVPDAHFNGPDRITYTVSDGNGGLATATVEVTVTPVNDAPSAGSLTDVFSRDGQTIAYPIAPRFGDPDTDPGVAQGASGDRLTFSAAGLPPGLAIDPATGLISGTLPPNASATPGYAVTVTATDRDGASVSRGFTWHIDNGAPVATPDAATTLQGQPVVVAVTANDADPDGDAFALVADPGRATASHGTVTVDPASGTLTYLPDPGFRGTDTIAYTIRDAQGDEGTGFLTISVAPANQRPIAPDRLAARIAADADRIDLDLGPYFADPDGDALAYAAIGLPPGLSLDPATGRITGRIDPSASGADGSHTYLVEVTARDPSGLAVTRAFAWTAINPPPEAGNDAVATAEETAIDIEVIQAGAPAGTPGRDTDPDGDRLAVVPGSLRAGHGTVSLNGDGTIRYVPEANFNGTDTILYNVADGNGGVSTGAVTVTVSPVNDVPLAGALADRAGADGEIVDLQTAPAFSDADSGDRAPASTPDRLTYAATGLPPGLSIDPATGRITGRIASDASTRAPEGRYAVTVTARDLAGAFASSSFTFTARNLAPLAGDDDIATDEDAPLTGSVLGNDADPDGDALAVATLRHPAHGTLALRPNGSFTYVPDPNYNGPDSFTYRLRDSDGATATATVRLTVRSVNDAPEAGAPPLSTPEDTPVDGRVAMRDVDGDPLAVAVEQPPRSGNLVLRPDGGYTYTPDRDFHGRDSFTLRVSDPNGGVTLVTVPVTIEPVNDAPDGSADPLVLPANTSAPGRVLATDRDGDAVRFRLASPPRNGTVALAPDGTYVYEPYDGYSGTDLFQVLASDGQGGETLIAVRVGVTPNPIEVRPPAPPAPAAPDPDDGRAWRPLAPPPVVTATGIILPTVAELGALRSISDTILADGAVVAAVNGVRFLGGIDIVPVRPAIQQEADRLARLGAELPAPEIGLETPWFSPRPFMGRSLGLTFGDEPGLASPLRDVVVEAIRRPDAFGLSLRNLAPETSGIVAITLRGADDGPAPAWLETDGSGSFWGRPPAGAGRVAVTVDVTLADGRVVRAPLDLDPETGEIRAGRKTSVPSRILPGSPDAEAPAALFTDQLGAAELRASRDLDLIEQALSRAP